MANKEKSRNSKGLLHDIQSSRDRRGLSIDQVGVCDLRYPITVLDRRNEKQHTVATVSLSVNLPHHFKGTHMSRFIKILNRYRGEVTMRTIPTILGEIKTNLQAESAHVDLSFPYFIEKAAPVSGETALMDYQCSFTAEANGNAYDFILGVAVPVKSLCPCSKAISKYGAHNQRGTISIKVRSIREKDGMPELIWIEELIALAEKSASSPVYPLLKREDEKYVTEHAFDNPMFVEDIVRNVAQKLHRDKRVAWYSVRVVNQESIHNHSAFARIERRSEADGNPVVKHAVPRVKRR
jgi:GTP cyclohydrolase I